MSGDAVAIIPAAGQGKRMAAGQNKLFLPLGTRTVLQHTLTLFLTQPRISQIYLVIARQDMDRLLSWTEGERRITLVAGGEKRQDSVFNALERIRQGALPKWILVHDGARPLCSSKLVERILKQCALTNAAIPVIPLTDTIREIRDSSSRVLNRSQLFATQTPQGFEARLLIEAYQALQNQGWQTTDDASVVEQWGHAVSPVEGDVFNLKITRQQDLKLAEWWLDLKTNP